jgi:hypothetical protein
MFEIVPIAAKARSSAPGSPPLVCARTAGMLPISATIKSVDGSKELFIMTMEFHNGL